MSWLSKGIRGAAKHSVGLKIVEKATKGLGLSTGNTLVRATHPWYVQAEKIKHGEKLNARLALDPGNEVMAADPKVAAQQAQINPLTGQPGTNARDLIAQQMTGAPTAGARPVVNPGIGNANSPTYGLGVGATGGGDRLGQIQQPRPPAAPPPNFGDINAIMDYVQGKRGGPAGTPMSGAPMGTPQKQPMFGPGRRFT
jgi:hypothetical protein